jgi:outer membrane protein assembly factor BamB
MNMRNSIFYTTSGILLLCLIVMIVPVAAESGLANSAWPKFGGDYNNTGQSPYIGSQTGTPKWSLSIPGISGSYFKYTTPVIGSDGTIYIGDTTSNISNKS